MKPSFASFLSVVLAGADAAKFDLPAFLESDGAESRLRMPKRSGAVLAQKGSESRKPAVAAAAKQKKSKGESRDATDSCGSDEATSPQASTVYTMNNQPENTIQAYSRNTDDGTLQLLGLFPTGGTGGVELGLGGLGGNTGGIIVREKCLLAVNAGSDDVSTLHIDPATGGLTVAGKFASGGGFPVSIAERDGLVYVLNAAGQGHIQAFSLLAYNCGLTPIGSPVELRRQGTVAPGSATAGQAFALGSPSHITFTPDGGHVVVVVKNIGGAATFEESPFGSISVYEIAADGTTSDAALQQSVITEAGSSIPFAVEFDGQGRMLVADASPPSVLVYDDPLATPIGQPDLSIATNQAGTCWVMYNPRNGCAYTTNTGSPDEIGNTLSSFTAGEGGVALAEEVAADGIIRPTEMALSPGGEHLYVISTTFVNNTGTPGLYVFDTTCDCGLEFVQDIHDGFGEIVPLEEAGFRGLGGGVEVGLAVYPQGF